MKKGQLSWFDKMMVGVTFAEANVEEPDLSHFKTQDRNSQSHVDNKEDGYEPFDGEAIPAQ